ncbi:MAG TPA: hypothetical protein ENI87_11700, partial [bacterium]|nr:hypothetical protein [bacterium]
GVNAHIYEGIEATHPDFTGGATNVRSGGAAQSHGHCTAGIVFGNGTSNPAVRGMAPDAGKFYTNYNSVNGSRWQVVSDLVNIYNVSHTTASWGNAQTTAYTSVSADADDITFDHDIAWTQSQSNTGNQNSRPQAWGKNIFSIGGVRHNNNSNPGDDSWAAGGASTGPAADGRIKPTLCAYYDAIGTSDRTGSAGYSSGNWYSNFGGTSGATPIVAGHNVLAIEMFARESATNPGYGEVFGNQLRVPGGSIHENRPHFPTLKALQVANAAQYSFTAASGDNRREHQGWGFPDLQQMYDRRGETFLIDETDVLTQGQVRSWGIAVAAGEPSLKVCLNWNEPAGNPAASQQLINNLSLRVTSPSGTVYWGNNGLENGVWSVAGGSEDTINSIECVFVQNPQAGNWNVEVLATAIVQDNHVETPAVDADYGLVVVGGTGTQVQFASFNTFGNGCPGSVPAPVSCPELNGGGGTLSGSTNNFEYTFRVDNPGTIDVLSFDIYTQSNSGTITRPAHIYLLNGSLPSTTPFASTTITVGGSPGFYTATFASPVTVTGTFFVGYENSPGGVISNLISGQSGTGYYRIAVTGSWSQSNLVQRPSWRVNCSATSGFLTPALGNQGLPQLGGSYDVTLSDALGTAFGVLASGLSNTTWNGSPLPAPLAGAPGCDLLVSPDVLDMVITSAGGTASRTFGVPNTASLVGFELFHQYAVLDAVNALGIVMSNGGRALVGN